MDKASVLQSSLPKFLQGARVRHEVKRSTVASVLGMHIESIRLWETGKNGIPLEKIAQVSAAYQLTDEEKEELEQLVLLQKIPGQEGEQISPLEYQAFCCMIALDADARKRVMAAVTAYLSAEKRKK